MKTYTKTIACLANSRKLSGRCVAGKELSGGAVGPWIRPVGSSPTGEVTEEDRRYQDGTDPALGDKVQIHFSAPAPKAYQVENQQIDSSQYWARAGRLTWADLSSLADHPKTLWENGNSSYSGTNDRVAEVLAATLGSSLYLIHIDTITVRVDAFGSSFGNPKRSLRGSFIYRGTPYVLSITDPVIEREYLAQPNGDYIVSDAYICVSLGEPFKGEVYKLIAAIITRSRLP